MTCNGLAREPASFEHGASSATAVRRASLIPVRRMTRLPSNRVSRTFTPHRHNNARPSDALFVTQGKVERIGENDRVRALVRQVSATASIEVTATGRGTSRAWPSRRAQGLGNGHIYARSFSEWARPRRAVGDVVAVTGNLFY